MKQKKDNIMVPTIIKSQQTKDLIVLYVLYAFVLIIITAILKTIGIVIPPMVMTKFLVVTIILHVMYIVFKSKTLGIIGKIVIELMLGLLILKTFVDIPILDRIMTFALICVLLIWFIKIIATRKTRRP